MKYINKRTGWQVGDKFFNNKWSAIQHASDNPLSYNAYCHDSTWNDVDWTIEPDQDIKQLEKNHAEYLRNKYKTLALFFSGGVDSSTVLDIFIEHKIQLDYICVWYVDKFDTAYNKDVQLAMQYLEENKSKLMGAKIICGKKLDHFEGNSIYNFKEDIRNTNWILRFHHLGHEENLKLRQPNIYNEIKENGCIITGGNKPYVYKDQKGFYMQFVDRNDENWGSPLQEMFWQGQDPTLQIKQCHLAKQWLEKHNSLSTNTIYQSNNTDIFWSLNEAFERTSIDEFFYKKHCFGDQINDKHFSQHYGRNWGNSYFANYFKEWQHSESYNNLVLALSKIDKKFLADHGTVGWLSEKRYLD
jgi:hypothetical protein